LQDIRIATGGPGGTYYPIGSALARAYNEQLPGLRASAEATSGSIFNINAVEQGTVDLAFARADTVYGAFAKGTPLNPRPHTQLRAVAVAFPSVLHVVVTSASRARTLADLRHRPIAYSGPSGDTRVPPIRYSDLVGGNGDPDADSAPEMMPLHLMVKGLTDGTFAAGFALSGYPLTLLEALARDVGIRLLEIEPDAAARFRARNPFYKPAILPARAYPGQPEPVGTIAVDNLLVCRADLEEELVHQLTSAFFAAAPKLTQKYQVAVQVDPDLAAATPIPLHPGAARYYREQALLR
jgi:TRAP transporter TAXI family solute receptor